MWSSFQCGLNLSFIPRLTGHNGRCAHLLKTTQEVCSRVWNIRNVGVKVAPSSSGMDEVSPR